MAEALLALLAQLGKDSLETGDAIGRSAQAPGLGLDPGLNAPADQARVDLGLETTRFPTGAPSPLPALELPPTLGDIVTSAEARGVPVAQAPRGTVTDVPRGTLGLDPGPVARGGELGTVPTPSPALNLPDPRVPPAVGEPLAQSFEVAQVGVPGEIALDDAVGPGPVPAPFEPRLPEPGEALPTGELSTGQRVLQTVGNISAVLHGRVPDIAGQKASELENVARAEELRLQEFQEATRAAAGILQRTDHLDDPDERAQALEREFRKLDDQFSPEGVQAISDALTKRPLIGTLTVNEMIEISPTFGALMQQDPDRAMELLQNEKFANRMENIAAAKIASQVGAMAAGMEEFFNRTPERREAWEEAMRDGMQPSDFAILNEHLPEKAAGEGDPRKITFTEREALRKRPDIANRFGFELPTGEAGTKIGEAEEDVRRGLISEEERAAIARKETRIPPETGAGGEGTQFGALTPAQVTAIRGQFLRESKDFQTRRNSFATIVASAIRETDASGAEVPSAAADLSLIFAYMKILDPGSVVREGEQATAENARGVPEQLRNLYNKITTGEKLTPRQRQDFVSRAEKLMQAATVQQMRREEGFRDIAGRTQTDPGLIVMDLIGPLRPTPPAGQEGATFQRFSPQGHPIFRRPDGSEFMETPD